MHIHIVIEMWDDGEAVRETIRGAFKSRTSAEERVARLNKEEGDTRRGFYIQQTRLED